MPCKQSRPILKRSLTVEPYNGGGEQSPPLSLSEGNTMHFEDVMFLLLMPIGMFLGVTLGEYASLYIP